jgi:hypothetical protein
MSLFSLRSYECSQLHYRQGSIVMLLAFRTKVTLNKAVTDTCVYSESSSPIRPPSPSCSESGIRLVIYDEEAITCAKLSRPLRVICP